MSSFPELDAFTAEAEALVATLELVPAGAWGGRGLGEWSLHELTAHVWRAAGLLADYVEEPPVWRDSAAPGPGRTPAFDRVGYWRFDLAAAAPGVADRARANAAGVDPGTWAQRTRDNARRSAEAAARLGPDAIVDTPRGPMLVREYLATRLVELVVHHLDVRRALGLDAAATPEAERIAAEILEGLLDGDVPAEVAGSGRTGFILAATGREPSDDPRLPVVR